MKTIIQNKNLKSSSKYTYKIFAIVLFFLLLANLLFVTPPVAKAEIKDKIVIGMDVNFPPMGFIDSNGNITGFDVEVARQVFKNLGKKVKFQAIDWDTKELELNSGKIDAIWNGLSKTPEREKNMLLTKAYMYNNQSIIVAKNSNIKSIKDLDGKNVDVQKGSTGEQALKQNPISQKINKIVALENMVNCLNEVETGKADATIVDENIAKYYLNKNNLEDKYRILKESLSVEEYVVAVKKDNVELKNAIDKELEIIANNGIGKEISEKYFGENVFEKTFDVKTSQTNKVAESISPFDFTIPFFKGFMVSIVLFAITFILSLPLGFLTCLLRRKNIRVLNWGIDAFVNIMRGTPLLLQLFFIFYGLPYLPYIGEYIAITDRFTAGALAFVINYTAYFTEIFRGGFKAIPKGQFEAAQVLGFTKTQTMFQIAIPQLLRVTLPSITNETVTLIKDTALIFTIGVVELLAVTKNIVNSTANISAYLVAFILYFSLSYIVTLGFRKLEKKYKFE